MTEHEQDREEQQDLGQGAELAEELEATRSEDELRAEITKRTNELAGFQLDVLAAIEQGSKLNDVVGAHSIDLALQVAERFSKNTGADKDKAERMVFMMALGNPALQQVDREAIVRELAKREVADQSFAEIDK